MSVEEFPEERLRQEFADLRHGRCDEEDCPPLETLWKSARAELDAEENEAVILHLGECPGCAAAWRFAGELSPAPAPVPLRAPARRLWAGTWMRAAAVAAVVVIGAGVGWLWLAPEEVGPPIFREQEPDLLAPVFGEDAVLPRAGFLLQWSPGPEGTTYQVRVTAEDLTPLARGRGLARPEFLVPEPALEGLAPGAAVYWQVTASLPDGRTVESESIRSRVE
jgi:hypothetical protein